MKTAVAANDPDPYREYRERYQTLMRRVASAFNSARKFGGCRG